MTIHTFPSNVYDSTVIQVLYYTTDAQCMLHPHISREGASNGVKLLKPIVSAAQTATRLARGLFVLYDLFPRLIAGLRGCAKY